MFINSFNRASINRGKRTKDSLDTGIKFNTNLDPGFEGFGEREDISVGAGVIAHFASTSQDSDPILAEAVSRGEYFQMAALELRAEL